MSAESCSGVAILFYVSIITDCQPIESMNKLRGLEYLSLCVEQKYFMAELLVCFILSLRDVTLTDGRDAI